MVLLYSEPIVKSYRASRLSFSYWFSWLIFAAIVILPFFLSFATNNFWIKRVEYNEQPKVLYRKELIITAYSSSEGSLGYSSLGTVNDLYSTNLLPVTVKSAIIDDNYDDIPDLYDFNITLHTPQDDLRNVKIYANFDVRLRHRIKLDTVALIYANIDLPVGGAEVFIEGEFTLKQKKPLATGTITSSVYNDTILETGSMSDVYLPLLLQRYQDRNFTAEYVHSPPLVRPGGQRSPTINMKIRIPTDASLAYVPPFLEVMKFAWVQYIALLLPVAFILGSFAKFLYSNQILESHVVSPFKATIAS